MQNQVETKKSETQTWLGHARAYCANGRAWAVHLRAIARVVYGDVAFQHAVAWYAYESDYLDLGTLLAAFDEMDALDAMRH